MATSAHRQRLSFLGFLESLGASYVQVLVLFILMLTLSACGYSRRVFIDTDARAGGRGAQKDEPPASSDLVYRVFLVGDTGVPGEYAKATLKLVAAKTQIESQKSAIVFLGDSVPCCGRPDQRAKTLEADSAIRTSLDVLKDYSGRVVFVPGDRDLNNSDEGFKRLRNLEVFIENELSAGNVFLPDGGTAGPHVIELSDDIKLVVLNTQWWFLDPERAVQQTGEYDLVAVLQDLDEALQDNRKDNLLVVGHHPFYSNGPHGGNFPARSHLVPVPLVGSIYPLYRHFIGTPQDFANVRYKAMRRGMEHLFQEYPDLIYAGGHDGSLQYFERGTFRGYRHYLVSGSAAKADYVARGHDAVFAANVPGFIELQYFADGSIWIEAWSSETDQDEPLFRDRLKNPVPEIIPTDLPEAEDLYPDYADSTKVVVANKDYASARSIRRTILGKHNRDAWGLEVEYPVLDWSREGGGGLTLLRFGGSGQSISVRLKGEDGKEYVLRSVDKVAGKSWSEEMKGTIASEFLQDQISIFHPFGALAVPRLADAVGVWHTNPRYVVVPDDPRLGIHRESLAGRLMLFEERPDDDMSHISSMGNAKNVVSYRTLYEKLNDNSSNQVDARMFVRARLLDMLIGDWDRHDDQWRWAEFETESGALYQPVPRDRDLAFHRFDGLVGFIGQLSFQPNYQGFAKSYGNLKQFTRNALPLDRRFTAELTKDDWTGIADSMRAELTDDILAKAIADWPAEAVSIVGYDAVETLKARRDKLTKVAEAHYATLSAVVDVVGTHNAERFEVIRLAGGDTEVLLIPLGDDGDPSAEVFRRTFHFSETKEIRLYGLEGADEFIVRGEAKRGIKVVAVGGAGEDKFVDDSRVSGIRKTTHFYDTTLENEWDTSSETKIVRSDLPKTNRYNPEEVKHNRVGPATVFGYDIDDGILFGAGLAFTMQGFRKSPYAAHHRFTAEYASKISAVNLHYDGHSVDVFGPVGIQYSASYYSSNNVRNFYGFGNETKSTDAKASFYQAEFSQIDLAMLLVRKVGGVAISFGPRLRRTDFEANPLRFPGQPAAGLSQESFDAQLIGSAEASANLEAVDSEQNPLTGFRWKNSAGLNVGLRKSDVTYGSLSTSLAIYLSAFLAPQLTVAGRIGTSHNIGNSPFYLANTLGATDNLRGFRSTRFSGRTSLFTNLEIRTRPLQSRGGFLGKIGLLAFYDGGRVWTDEEKSKSWHSGYGGGVWLGLFGLATPNVTYAISEDGTMVSVGLGFLF